MAKFNLIEHISKNKSTFFGSLTEGQFSWMTQDTGQQIGSQDENKIPVYMFDDKGKYYYEKDYDGYGVFGGKDYYELLDQMNGGKGDRSRGIDLAFGEVKTSSPVLYPALITRPGEFNYRTHDFTQEAKHDPNQSWYDASYEEDEDDDYGSDNEDEDYDYSYKDELDEGFQGQFYAPEYLEQKYGKEMASKITDEIDEMDENSWDRFTEFTSAEEVEDYISDIKDTLNLNEGEAAYEYEKGKEAGEKIEKKKMKVSELKAKIKEMVLSEMDGPAVEDAQYDFLKEIEEMLNEAKDEETDTEEVDAEATDDVTADADAVVDTEVDVTTDEVDPNVKAVQDALTQAQAAAQQLGDPKLTDQIGNTITFFTRSHVVEKPKGAMAEGLNETLLLQKRAGIITETQYKQKLNEIENFDKSDFLKDKPDWLKDIYASNNNQDEENKVPLTNDVEKFIDKTIADSKADNSFNDLIEADWFENELIDELINLFPDKDYDSASPEVMNYISQAIK